MIHDGTALAPKHQIRRIADPHEAGIQLVAEGAVKARVQAVEFFREQTAVAVAQLAGNGHALKGSKILGFYNAHAGVVLIQVTCVQQIIGVVDFGNTRIVGTHLGMGRIGRRPRGGRRIRGKVNAVLAASNPEAMNIIQRGAVHHQDGFAVAFGSAGIKGVQNRRGHHGRAHHGIVFVFLQQSFAHGFFLAFAVAVFL